MSYKYKINNNVCILNFSEEYPTSPLDLIESEGFKEIVSRYLDYLNNHKGEVYNYISVCCNLSWGPAVDDILLLAKLLLVMNRCEISENYPKLKPYLWKPHIFLKFIEGLYLFWRRLQRYGIVVNDHSLSSLEDGAFLQAQTNFRDLVLRTYRICESSLGFKNLVYRQIIAGVNAGLNLTQAELDIPDEYSCLSQIPVINRVNITPPFIMNSAQNKRSGVFDEVFENPIAGKNFDPQEWFCYPAKVGTLLIFVYFNIGFMSQGVSLSNLFEMADKSEYVGRKPDLIYVCGYDDGQKNQQFYQDKDNDMVVGYLSLDKDFDYFGYMKKMILTLHNIQRINHDCLPIHGAMVEINFLDGKTKNVIIMGDSGAGKSETIEQIKSLGSDIIDYVKIVYDDMGLLMFNTNDQVVSSGTEIGAFVRLNDLDSGYAFRELDRAVIMNPEKTNARIVVPAAQWNDVTWKYDIDYFLYANNYEQKEQLVELFDNIDDAYDVFKSGRRMAKGTTSEKGISESFFANPFGPVQRQEQTEILIKKYFKAMFEQGIKVGQIYTGLGVEGLTSQGPKNAAAQFLEQLK